MAERRGTRAGPGRRTASVGCVPVSYVRIQITCVKMCLIKLLVPPELSHGEYGEVAVGWMHELTEKRECTGSSRGLGSTYTRGYRFFARCVAIGKSML